MLLTCIVVHRSIILSLTLSPSLSGLTTESGCVGVARVGTSTQCIASDTLFPGGTLHGHCGNCPPSGRENVDFSGLASSATYQSRDRSY